MEAEEAGRKVQAASEVAAAAERSITAAQLKAAAAVSDADARVPSPLLERKLNPLN